MVQGVGFRYSTVRMARNTGIKGFVHNQIDGSVYIEAEGTPFQLSKFLDWCYQGPSRAQVYNVEYVEADVLNFQGFDVKSGYY
jgi:acylphosphatase